jgi:hypothetical protein
VMYCCWNCRVAGPVKEGAKYPTGKVRLPGAGQLEAPAGGGGGGGGACVGLGEGRRVGVGLDPGVGFAVGEDDGLGVEPEGVAPPAGRWDGEVDGFWVWVGLVDLDGVGPTAWAVFWQVLDEAQAFTTTDRDPHGRNSTGSMIPMTTAAANLIPDSLNAPPGGVFCPGGPGCLPGAL